MQTQGVGVTGAIGSEPLDPPPPAQLPAWLFVGGAVAVLIALQAIPSVALRSIVLLLASLLGYVGFVRRVEHRRPFELGGGLLGLGQFGLGWALALWPLLLIVAIWLAFAGARILRLEDWQVVALTADALLFGASGAFFEELAFRGLALRYLELKLGSYAAVILSALLFAGWHLLSPAVGWLRFTEIALSGLSLGFAYILTRRLWLSIGLHVGHNVMGGLLLPSSTTIPLLVWERAGASIWLGEDGSRTLLIVGEALIVVLLLTAVIVKHRAARPSAAWLHQLGSTASPPELESAVTLGSTVSAMNSEPGS